LKISPLIFGVKAQRKLKMVKWNIGQEILDGIVR